MRIYMPNSKEDGIGGGFTFWRNLKRGLAAKAHFVDSWEECDIFFITGITVVDLNEVKEAHKAGKHIILRVDNVPRKSRNKRSSPHERLQEIAALASVVIYQSQWAKEYCYPLCGEGTIIYNGVDQKIFSKSDKNAENYENNYLYLYHGHNELKNFWLAHLYFQYIARENPNAKFYFVYDFQKDLEELQKAKFDFWNGEQFQYLDKIDDPVVISHLMRSCKYFIYPAVSDASPNVVLEARASGMEVIHAAPKELAGTQELLDQNLDISLERMCEEYYGVFEVTLNA